MKTLDLHGWVQLQHHCRSLTLFGAKQPARLEFIHLNYLYLHKGYNIVVVYRQGLGEERGSVFSKVTKYVEKEFIHKYDFKWQADRQLGMSVMLMVKGPDLKHYPSMFSRYMLDPLSYSSILCFSLVDQHLQFLGLDFFCLGIWFADFVGTDALCLQTSLPGVDVNEYCTTNDDFIN